MMRTFRHIAAAVLVIVVHASISLAASLSITPASGNKFYVMGNNMDGVSGIDVVIQYDTPALSSPTVEQGTFVSNAMFAANPNFTANTIKIAIIKGTAFSGSGPLAIITFAKGSGSIRFASEPQLINDSAAPVTSNTATNQETTTAEPGSGNTSTTTTPETPPSEGTTAVTPTISTSLGTVTMPSETQSQPPHQPEAAPGESGMEPSHPAEQAAPSEAEPPPEEQPAPAPPAREPVKHEAAQYTAYGSVLERFRAYTGEKSPAILMALFRKEVAPTITQEPEIALSDGSTKILVHVTLTATNDQSPNFALNGASLVSLKRGDTAGTWLIEALPRANTYKASLTILSGASVTEFPFTIAPPITDVATKEDGFAAFLRKPADLNHDGTYDYIDEFIYTANYLARKGGAETAGKKVKSP